MARVPRIDSPCPLSMAEQLKIDGHCGRCNKTVHALDELDERQRRALFASARGPLCVSYRAPAIRSPAMAVAMAGMLSAGSVIAGQGCPQAAAGLLPNESAPVCPVSEVEETNQSEKYESIFVGGVSTPEDASWIDDSELPDLPIVVESVAFSAADSTRPISDPVKPR